MTAGGLRGFLRPGHGCGGGDGLYGRREDGADRVEAVVGRLVGCRLEPCAP